MATFQQIDRLKQWLDRSELKTTNFSLYQIILVLIDVVRQGQITTQEIIDTGGGGGGGGSGLALTALNTDVVAVGPGAVPAIIQPNVVTYPKIQKVVNGQRLLGSELPLQDVLELALGSGLEITDGILDIQQPGGGGVGLEHKFLSPTHPDTQPADPVIGDIVRAVEGVAFVGTYVQAVIISPIVEDFEGVRVGYTGVNPLNANYGAYVPPAFPFVAVQPDDIWLTTDILNGFIQSPVVEDFEGIDAGMNALVPGQTVPGPGNSGGYSRYPHTFIPSPSPSHDTGDARWQRYGIGAPGQLLTVVDGKPEWADLEGCAVPLVCPWVSIPFLAGDFTATGGVTPGWAVDLADVVRWEYQVFTTEDNLNNSVRIALYLKTTSVSGSAPTQLQIHLPFNIVGAFSQMVGLQENSVSVTNAFVAYDSAVSANTLFIQKIPFAGGGPVFNTVANETYLSFEISAKVTGLAGCFLDCGGAGGGSGGVGPPGPPGPAGPAGPTLPFLAFTNVDNLFSVSQTTERITPLIRLRDTAGAADQKVSRLFNTGGNLNITTNDDAESSNQSRLWLPRDNTVRNQGAYHERGRAVAMGDWNAIAFNAANFSVYSSPGMTWTVASGDVWNNSYTMIGKTMLWQILMAASTIGGTSGAYLQIATPGGFSVNGTGPLDGFAAGGASVLTSGVYQGNGPTILLLFAASGIVWPLGNCQIRASMIFQVA